MHFTGRGDAEWSLVWSTQPSSDPINPKEGPKSNNFRGPHNPTGSQHPHNSSGPHQAPSPYSGDVSGVPHDSVAGGCAVCGACGVVFAVFQRKMHHHPWVLFQQTQANKMDLDSIEVGSELQLIAVANCGPVSVIITPYEPVGGPTKNSTNLRTAGRPRPDLFLHERRYQTLAQHYANKIAKVNFEETVPTTVSPLPRQDSSVIGSSAVSSVMGSSELTGAAVQSPTWTLHYNASVNMTDLIYTKIWWNASDIAAAAQHKSDENDVRSGIPKPDGVPESDIDYLVTWEDLSGTVKGHSMTRNAYISFDLWPHTVYKIQAQVVMGPVMEPILSSPLLIDAAKLYRDLSKELPGNTGDENEFPSYGRKEEPSKIPQDRVSDQSEKESSHEIKNKNILKSANDSKNFTRSDSYVYAEVETDYVPLSVETVTFKPPSVFKKVLSPTRNFNRDFGVEQETETPRQQNFKLDSDAMREFSAESSRSSMRGEDFGIYKNAVLYSGAADHSLGAADPHTAQDDNSATLSGDIIAGIVSAFIFVLLMIVFVSLYVRYYLRKVRKNQGSFKTDGYDTSSSVSSKDTDKSDDRNTPLRVKTTRRKWFPFRHVKTMATFSKADDVANSYGFVGKSNDSNSRGADSRSTSIEFSLQSSESLINSNNSTAHNTCKQTGSSGTPAVRVGMPGSVYNASMCSTSDCSTTIRYTHSPHNQLLPPATTNNPERNEGCQPQDVYGQVDESFRPICGLPDLTSDCGVYEQPVGYPIMPRSARTYAGQMTTHSRGTPIFSSEMPRSLPCFGSEGADSCLIQQAGEAASGNPNLRDGRYFPSHNSSLNMGPILKPAHYLSSAACCDSGSSCPTPDHFSPRSQVVFDCPFPSSCSTPNNCIVPSRLTPVEFVQRPPYQISACVATSNCRNSPHATTSYHPNAYQLRTLQTPSNLSYQEHQITPNLSYCERQPTPNLSYSERQPTPNQSYSERQPTPNLSYVERRPTPNLSYSERQPTPNLSYDELQNNPNVPYPQPHQVPHTTQVPQATQGPTNSRGPVPKPRPRQLLPQVSSSKPAVPKKPRNLPQKSPNNGKL
ncbi:uncharacterized protein LOC125179475 [Hyalella azteca]|uniref:Uncharacterized protein LOC125179475 n=1 Tax=Hyalella azteca TaxID=294128 RepID=A0A979FXS9_HYAAZ|nr:uncharacterized protein LOC125179475 [Hyalella azteca]